MEKFPWCAQGITASRSSLITYQRATAHAGKRGGESDQSGGAVPATVGEKKAKANVLAVAKCAGGLSPSTLVVHAESFLQLLSDLQN